MVLNYKQIPFKTEFSSYPDIEAKCRELGIEPTTTSDPCYTFPAIADPNGNGGYTYVSDSYKIARYLEKTYPNTKPIFPANTLPLQHIFRSHLVPIFWGPCFPLLLPLVPPMLDDRGAEYFIRTREASFGKKMSELVPDGSKSWAKVHESWGELVELLEMNGRKMEEIGPFVMGNELSYVDLEIMGLLYMIYRVDGGKVGGGMESGQKFKMIMEWHDGRWKKIWEALEKYTL